MQKLAEFIDQHPVVPYIRECDFAVRKPWFMPERRLLDYLFIYVQDGECLFTIDDQPYRFEKGEFCLIQPGSLNKLEGLSNTVTPFAHFDMFYQAERGQSFPTRAGQVDISAYERLLQPRIDRLLQLDIPVRLRPSNRVKFRDTFLQVVEFWQYRDPVYQLKAQAGMTELVIMLLEDLLPSGPSQRTPPQTLNWITSYFSLHINEPLTVHEMAKRANLSPSRFNVIFKQQYGKTPHQYLMEMRLNHACELLENSDLSLEQISDYCGFSDLHHLSKQFKRRIGLSPGQYRGVKKGNH